MRAVCINCDSRQSGHWCSQCGSILPTPENENYFNILGLPQQINLDEEVLKERFFDLNRAFHPDRAAKMKDERTREIAIRKSILINNGFQTLRDRTRRIQYLIRQELGERDEKSGHVPLALFDLVEEVNELMVRAHAAKKSPSSTAGGDVPADAMILPRLTSQLKAHLKDLASHREAFEQNLRAKESEWDAICDRTQNFERMDEETKLQRRRIMETLAVKMDEISYIDSLIRRIKDTLYE
jgi:molecular chaperone HscB